MDNKILDKYFFQILNVLYKSLEAGKGGPFGAGVVLNGELISTGTNEVVKTFDVSKHAEVVALANATKKVENFHVENGILLTTHFPCLMCYHAAKWAKISKAYFIFDYEQTENLFGFHGDERFLCDLNISEKTLFNDPSIVLKRYESDFVKEKYFAELVKRWNEDFKARLLGYDV